MQDGREKLLNKSGKKPGQKVKEALLDANEEGISELERLKRENAKLMRMLEEQKEGKDGMCSTTCSV